MTDLWGNISIWSQLHWTQYCAEQRVHVTKLTFTCDTVHVDLLMANTNIVLQWCIHVTDTCSTIAIDSLRFLMKIPNHLRWLCSSCESLWAHQIHSSRPSDDYKVKKSLIGKLCCTCCHDVWNVPNTIPQSMCAVSPPYLQPVIYLQTYKMQSVERWTFFKVN